MTKIISGAAPISSRNFIQNEVLIKTQLCVGTSSKHATKLTF